MKIDDFLSNNVNDFAGELLLCDSYVIRRYPDLVSTVSAGKPVYTYVPELSHIDQFGFKLTTILRLRRVSSVTIFTKDGSPHSVQIPLVTQEAAENVGFPSSALRFFVVEKNELVSISGVAVRKARHLSEIELLISASMPQGLNTPEEDIRKQNIPEVTILLGGRSDLQSLQQSGMLNILQEMEIAYEISVISSEQNPEELRAYCSQVLSRTTRVCICIAGLVPGLPAAVKSHLPMLPVISVPLSAPGVSARDILMASFSLPSRRPVILAGIDETGLKKAANLACELLAVSSPSLRSRYERHIVESTPPPNYSVVIDDTNSQLTHERADKPHSDMNDPVNDQQRR